MIFTNMYDNMPMNNLSLKLLWFHLMHVMKLIILDEHRGRNNIPLMWSPGMLQLSLGNT